MKSIGIAVAVGLLVGIVMGVLLNVVPAIGNLVPADWHGALVGGAAGGAAAVAVGKNRRKT